MQRIVSEHQVGTLHSFVGTFPNLWKFPFEKISSDSDMFNIPSAFSVQELKFNLV